VFKDTQLLYIAPCEIRLKRSNKVLNFLKILLGVFFIFLAVNVYASEEYELFKRYTEGDKTALDELLSHAEKNEITAQLWLGNLYQSDKNYTEALTWFTRAADTGDAAARHNIGDMYLNGRGVSQDYEKAFYWLKAAAEQNLPIAQNKLGRLYETGQGTEENHEEAANWYRKAAENGLKAAQGNLGALYLSGKGVQQNYREAIIWLSKAAEQGDVGSYMILGAIYWSNGDPKNTQIPRNDQEAIKWFQKAADQGSSPAMHHVGSIYEDGGVGVIRDTNKAKTWYELAAQKGNAPAMNQLGWFYEHGIATEPNIKEALSWYRKGAANNQAAKENLARLEQQISKSASASSVSQAASVAPGSKDNPCLELYAGLPYIAKGEKGDDAYLLVEKYKDNKSVAVEITRSNARSFMDREQKKMLCSDLVSMLKTGKLRRKD